MSNPDIDWLYALKDKLYHFVRSMATSDFSHIRYAYSGDFYNEKIHWGLGNMVFAIRVLYASNMLNKLSTRELYSINNTIQSFQSGYYYTDPIFNNVTFKDRLKHKIGLLHFKEDLSRQRAETRQTFAALYLLGEKPGDPYEEIPQQPEKIKAFLANMDWTQPWAAGSHFNHLLFFLTMNRHFFPEKFNDSHKAIKTAIEWIQTIQSRKTGAWYANENISLKQKINGSMKVLNGLHAAEIYEFPHPEKLIDLALYGINDKEACSNFNIVYVLYASSLLAPDYRAEEIRAFLLNRLQIYKSYFHTNLGGFSFHPKQASRKYYGKLLSKGLNEPDIHGTAMFVWGIAVINKILDLGLDFKIPVN